MKTLALVCLCASTAYADQLGAHLDESGHITKIDRGVWELDLGALGVLTSDHQGDASVTRLSSDLSAGVHYYIRDNVAVGGEALFAYDSPGDDTTAVTFGGAVDATLNLRLGLGAFFRPGLAAGMLFGSRDIAMPGSTTIDRASQIGFVSHVRLPIAYFTSRHILLQAGPQLDVTIGSYSLAGQATSFTRVAGGFAVGAGYAF